MSRTENGNTVRASQGVEFVAADLVAKIAGVSLSTVCKVIAALDVLEYEMDIDPSLLIDYSRTPVALPDEERARQTNEATAILARLRDAAVERAKTHHVPPMTLETWGKLKL